MTSFRSCILMVRDVARTAVFFEAGLNYRVVAASSRFAELRLSDGKTSHRIEVVQAGGEAQSITGERPLACDAPTTVGRPVTAGSGPSGCRLQPIPCLQRP